MDLNLLKLLPVLADEKSVTKAADRLFMSQSAFSHALNRVREQLDDPLFIRTSQGMEPTPRARQLIPVIRESLGRLERGMTGSRQFDPATSARTFYLGAVDYFEFLGLPRLVSKFKREAPNIRLSVDILAEKIQHEGVESGQLDVFVGIDSLQYVPHFLINAPGCRIGLSPLRRGIVRIFRHSYRSSSFWPSRKSTCRL